MVNLGQPFELYAPNQAKPLATCSESWWIGLWGEYWIVDWSQPVRFYGVHFKPAGVYPFLQLPLSELHNQVVPVDAIWRQFAAELRKRLYHAQTPQAGFVLLERLLLERLVEAPYGMEVDWGRIARQSRFYDLSHLNKDFVDFTGHSPSDYLRMRRRFHVENPDHPLEVGPLPTD